jgi:hypothetical protein
MRHTFQWQGCFALEKSYPFHMTFDEDDFYMKIVTLDKIYNFSSFEFLSSGISLHAQKII